MTELEKSLFACTTDEHSNKALRGVYTKDDYITASDSTVFIKVFRPFDFDESLIGADGREIGDKYPSIIGVIPEDFKSLAEKVSLAELKKAAELIPKSPDKDWKRIALNLDGLCLYPPRVLKAIRIFEILGDTEVTLSIYNDRAVIGSGKAVAVIMGLGLKNRQLEQIENYTIESINLIADLL